MRKFLHLQLVVLFSLASAASPGYAQRANETPWMTGERLVKLMGNVDPATVGWTPESPFPNRTIAAEYLDLVNSEFVLGYIQAVHDASEGKAWCWSQQKPKPHELDADVRISLQRMSAAQLKRNAAEIIVEHWRSKFPCTLESQGRAK